MKRALAGCFAFVAAVAAFFVSNATPAAAELTENTIGCAGSAVVTDDDGQTYQADAEDDEVKMPRNGSAAWQGSVGTVTHNHFGEVVFEFGPIDIELGSWGVSRNANDESADSGVKDLPSILEQVPAGKYDVSGFHQGDEGRCAGGVTVELDGSPFDTIAGIANAVLGLLFAILLGVAMFSGRRILGALSGILFGLFLAIELIFLGLISSGSPLVMIVPIVVFVIGLVVSMISAGRAAAV